MPGMTPRLPPPLVSSHSNQEIHDRLQVAESLQWRGALRIRRIQLNLLRHLCSHAKKHSPFYQERLARLDTDNLDWQGFSRIPALTREELRNRAAEIDCREVPEQHGRISATVTSGSTGSPVEIRSTEVVTLLWQVNALRDHLWHQRNASLTMGGIRWRTDAQAMAPQGWELEDWGEPHNQFYKTGQAFFLNSSSSTEDQLKWWLDKDPHYLISHPSNLRALLLLMQSSHQRPERIRQLRTVGETVTAELRHLAREVLGVPLSDFYSSQELGYIALQCPLQAHYHVLSDSVIVEVVREDGSPCEPGELGRVLVTSLHNYVTPLIRYAIGDMAVTGPDCRCGRGLPVLTEIAGRVRNMLRLPDGSTHWPNFGFRRLLEIADLEQFQIVQTTVNAIEFRAVVGSPLDKEQELAISEVLNQHLGHRFDVSFAYPDSIPRSAGGKYEDFVSLVDQ